MQCDDASLDWHLTAPAMRIPNWSKLSHLELKSVQWPAAMSTHGYVATGLLTFS